MSTYFITTWTRQLRGAARNRAEKALDKIDPEATLVCISEAGNRVRMWLERPNDGTNDANYRSARNRECIEAVNACLEKVRS